MPQLRAARRASSFTCAGQQSHIRTGRRPGLFARRFKLIVRNSVFTTATSSHRLCNRQTVTFGGAAACTSLCAWTVSVLLSPRNSCGRYSCVSGPLQIIATCVTAALVKLLGTFCVGSTFPRPARGSRMMLPRKSPMNSGTPVSSRFMTTASSKPPRESINHCVQDHEM